MVFTGLGLGALLVGPALALAGLWREGMTIAAVLWMSAVVVIAVLDSLLSRTLARLQISRSLPNPLSLNSRNPVTLRLRNRGRAPQNLIVLDDLPDELRPEGNLQTVVVHPYGEAAVRYTVRPAQRGKFALGDVYVRGLGLFRLSRWQRRYRLGGEVRVYPALADVVRYDYLARARRLVEAGFRPIPRRGEGRSFESLREYVRDDDFRDIDWKATARRGRPITRQYEVERSQNVVLLLDCGRLMAAETEGMTKLDHAVNAALMIAHVAVAMDDAVGWIAFADRILRMRPPRKARDQVARLAEDLYEIQVQLVEPNYALAFAPLKGAMRKRALVVVFTDIVDLEASERLVSHAAALHPHHLPLLVAIRDAELESLASEPPARVDDVYVAAVATRLLDRRAHALAAMRARGALVLDVAPHELTTKAVNEYLSVKAAGKL